MENVYLDTSFIQATPRVRLDAACSTDAILVVTNQGQQECLDRGLSLPNGTLVQSGCQWHDFSNHGQGFYTYADETSGTTLQAQRGNIGWDKRLLCGCVASSVMWHEGQTFYLCREMSDDPVDFSYFVNCILNSNSTVLTLDKHLGWALGNRALFGSSVENARPWSEVTPNLLREIEQSRAAFNGISNHVFNH